MPALPGLVISPVVATFWKCLQSGVAFQTGLDCTTDWVDTKIFSGIYFYFTKKFLFLDLSFSRFIYQNSGWMKTLNWLTAL